MATLMLIEVPEPDSGGGVLFFGVLLLAAIGWLIDTITNYSQLAVPYYYFGWLFYHILLVPAKFIIYFGGELYSFLNNGLTPWANMNWVIALAVSAAYWILIAIAGFFSLYVYVPLAILSGLLMGLWVSLRWLFS